MDPENIYPSLPLKEAGKRKRNESCPSPPSIINEASHPSKKHKPETVTSTNFTYNKKRPNATIVSPREDDNHLNVDNAQSTMNVLVEEHNDDNDISSTSNHDRQNNGKVNANNKNKKFRHKRNNNKAKVGQSSSKPLAPFDYAQVDFKKFQGGSKKNESKNDIQTKFHRKVQKIHIFYKFNTSMKKNALFYISEQE